MPYHLRSHCRNHINPLVSTNHSTLCPSGIQEKLGIANKGAVYAVFDYEASRKDELSFENGHVMSVLRKGDSKERHWWWSKKAKHEGYIPRNLLGVSVGPVGGSTGGK